MLTARRMPRRTAQTPEGLGWTPSGAAGDERRASVATAARFMWTPPRDRMPRRWPNPFSGTGAGVGRRTRKQGPFHPAHETHKPLTWLKLRCPSRGQGRRRISDDPCTGGSALYMYCTSPLLPRRPGTAGTPCDERVSASAYRSVRAERPGGMRRFGGIRADGEPRKPDLLECRSRPTRARADRLVPPSAATASAAPLRDRRAGPGVRAGTPRPPRRRPGLRPPGRSRRDRSARRRTGTPPGCPVP